MDIGNVIHAILDKEIRESYGLNQLDFRHDLKVDEVTCTFMFNKGKENAVKFFADCEIDISDIYVVYDQIAEDIVYVNPFTSSTKVYWASDKSFCGVNIDKVTKAYEVKEYINNQSSILKVVDGNISSEYTINLNTSSFSSEVFDGVLFTIF
jgi:hypothetical protein